VQSADFVGGSGFATVNGGSATSGFRFTLSPFARVGAVSSADVSLGAHAPTMVEPVGTNLLALEGGMLDVFKVAGTPFSVSYTGQAIAIPRTPDVSEVSAAYTGSRFLVAANGMVRPFCSTSAAPWRPSRASTLAGRSPRTAPISCSHNSRETR